MKKQGQLKQKTKLPEFFTSLFWSYKFSWLQLEKNKQRIIINTINYGSWKHWQWIIENYGEKEIKNIIENAPISEFRERALRLISLLLGIKKIKYASRSIKIRRQRNFPKI
ncbi:MAG: hypothetical protein Athens101410_616 [Parcubacteria group bacterium Athens1014_10]|nr:MAG: hypothetical protein Athens101410_616 [Parcubacteria group bacterium Athens1014_10]TSD04802.1 MAG: hypothetical protein Athens071412_586 [Parcubacteria group bacterium Athens0714_12]